MEKLSDALLIIDLQKGVCLENGTIDHFSELIALVNERINRYRKQEKPIIFIQHCDEDLLENSEAWEIVEELDRRPDDPTLQKTHANSFYHTELQERLQHLKIQSLELCGAQTQYCMDATIKFAHGSGYSLSMARQASTTYDNEFLSAKDTISFYESIWDKRFLTFIQ